MAEIFPWGVDIGEKRENKLFSLVFNENMSHSSFFLHGLMIWEEGGGGDGAIGEGDVVKRKEGEGDKRKEDEGARWGRGGGGSGEGVRKGEEGGERGGEGGGEGGEGGGEGGEEGGDVEENGREGGREVKEREYLNLKETDKGDEEREWSKIEGGWEELKPEEETERVGFAIKNKINPRVKRLYYPTTLIIKTKCYHHEEMMKLLQTLYNILVEDHEINGLITKSYVKNKVKTYY